MVWHGGAIPIPLLISYPQPLFLRLQDQGPALDELRKTVLRLHPDLKDKSAFWKRRTSVLKVCWVCREGGHRALPDRLSYSGCCASCPCGVGVPRFARSMFPDHSQIWSCGCSRFVQQLQ